MNRRSFKSFLEPGEEILLDSHPITKPWQWMPWGLVAIGIFAVLVAVKEAYEGRTAFAPLALAIAGGGWPVYFIARTQVIFTKRVLLYKPGGLAKVRQLPVGEIVSIAMKGTRGRRGFLVEMTNGRWLRLGEFPAPDAFWQRLPPDKKAPVCPQAAKRWDRLNWTLTTLWLPLLLVCLVPIFWTMVVYGEHAPIASRAIGTALFLLIAFLGLALSFIGSWLIAACLALRLWRKTIPIAEAKACFIWDLDPGHGSLSSRLNSALLPLGAWILHRVYGQPVNFDLGR